MKYEKLYSIFFYLVLALIGIIILTAVILSSYSFLEGLGYSLAILGLVTSFIRSFKLENYFLALDQKPKISFFRHYIGMASDIYKGMTIYLLIRPFFKRQGFDNLRKQVNLYTYLTYFFLIAMFVTLKIVYS